jgi:hypothetical protein
MLPYQVIDGGSFTSDASSNKYEVQVSDRPDLIWVRNRDAWGDDAAETSVESWWRQGMAQGAAQTADQAVTTGILSAEAVTANGFRVYNTWNPPTYAALATTAISNVEPSVATMASTGSIQVGDIVRLDNTTAMLQISGYDFEVRGVTTNTNITLQFDGQNEAAAATAGNVRLIIPGRMYPRWRYIVPYEENAGITQAAQPIVSFSVSHDFQVGEKVSFRVPSAYGMDEINNQSATVLSRGNVVEGVYTAVTGNTAATSIQIDLDTSGYTAFSLPASATYAAGVSPAVCVPCGS